jgi:hypothetical protein
VVTGDADLKDLPGVAYVKWVSRTVLPFRVDRDSLPVVPLLKFWQEE